MFRRTSSAARGEGTTASTVRVPPQRHLQTSTPNVRLCSLAQSSRGRRGETAAVALQGGEVLSTGADGAGSSAGGMREGRNRARGAIETRPG
jgi:hypothetical protein